MTHFLLVVQVFLVVFIVIAVMLQKSSSIGLGAYSGSNESVFGAKGAGGFLTKVTFTLGTLFVLNTVALGYLFAKHKNESVLDSMVEKTNVAAPIAAPVNDLNLTPTK